MYVMFQNWIISNQINKHKEKSTRNTSDRNKWKIISEFVSWQESVKYNTVEASDLFAHRPRSLWVKKSKTQYYFSHKTNNTLEITNERITSDTIPLFTRNNKVQNNMKNYLVNLAFMGPCIVNEFLSTTNEMHHTIFFIVVSALRVSSGFSAHHQELKHCTCSIGYQSNFFGATTSMGESELVCVCSSSVLYMFQAVFSARNMQSTDNNKEHCVTLYLVGCAQEYLVNI